MVRSRKSEQDHGYSAYWGLSVVCRYLHEHQHVINIVDTYYTMHVCNQAVCHNPTHNNVCDTDHNCIKTIIPGNLAYILPPCHTQCCVTAV